MPELEDAARRVSAGDNGAFRLIVERCSTRLVRLGARMVGSVADAEDLVQDAFVKAHRALLDNQFDGRSSIETWLYRIVTNACLDHLRSSKCRRREVEPSDELMAEDGNSAEARVALRELDAWMSDLAPEQRVALVLSAMEGFSNTEIAKLMGCSEGSVEQRLVRARAALRQRRNLEHDQN